MQTVESFLALVQLFKGTVCVIIALLMKSKLKNLTVLCPISMEEPYNDNNISSPNFSWLKSAT